MTMNDNIDVKLYKALTIKNEVLLLSAQNSVSSELKFVIMNFAIFIKSQATG